jgi:creatinine amidohydrolase
MARLMHVHDCNWMQLEDYLRRDDRIVLPLGSTEQHAYLSLGTDNILSERVAVEAAEPLGVPVLPALAYGITPLYAAYPGSPSLRLETHARVLRDLLESLLGQGFRRILVVNGHGGNGPTRTVLSEWMAERADGDALWHDWYHGPKLRAAAEAVGPLIHANWSENFPWNRVAGVQLPREPKPEVDPPLTTPSDFREAVGDGSYGGAYAVSDDEMLRLWQVAVEEVRDLLEHGWR